MIETFAVSRETIYEPENINKIVRLAAALLETMSASEALFNALERIAEKFDFATIRSLPDSMRDVELQKVYELTSWFDQITSAHTANGTLLDHCTKTLRAHLDEKDPAA